MFTRAGPFLELPEPKSAVSPPSSYQNCRYCDGLELLRSFVFCCVRMGWSGPDEDDRGVCAYFGWEDLKTRRPGWTPRGRRRRRGGRRLNLGIRLNRISHSRTPTSHAFPGTLTHSQKYTHSPIKSDPQARITDRISGVRLRAKRGSSLRSRRPSGY